MKTFLTISVLALLTLTDAQAKEDAAVKLQVKSAFTMEASGRNPFWPIGWKPVAKANTTQYTGPEVQPSAFVVSSITLDKGGRFAIINGKRCRQVSNLDCRSAPRPISLRSRRSRTVA